MPASRWFLLPCFCHSCSPPEVKCVRIIKETHIIQITIYPKKYQLISLRLKNQRLIKKVQDSLKSPALLFHI
ncbi:hypothetical protein CBE79_15250 [Priestia megaterium]|nr:hypothetical protein CBE78_11380 [Priestia megaterium]TPF24161.1 hypothetical protein CBE79_15250 [Priestia megaterium]